MPMIQSAIGPVNSEPIPDDVMVDDESWAEYLRMVELVEHRHREYGEPLLPLAAWVEVQAAYYRSLESEAGALVAERLDGLASELRALDAPSTVVYRDRRAAMLEVMGR